MLTNTNQNPGIGVLVYSTFYCQPIKIQSCHPDKRQVHLRYYTTQMLQDLFKVLSSTLLLVRYTLNKMLVEVGRGWSKQLVTVGHFDWSFRVIALTIRDWSLDHL